MICELPGEEWVLELPVDEPVGAELSSGFGKGRGKCV